MSHVLVQNFSLSGCAHVGSCDLSCVRRQMEQKMKSSIKALKKSINQERFLIRVAGLEYEVAQKVTQSIDKQEHCGPGREKDSGRCGKRITLKLDYE